MSTSISTGPSVATPMARVEGAPYLTCAAPGTYKSGQVVTCHPGAWTGDDLTITYQWLRDAADLVGETAATYTLVQADETHKVRCLVTATPANTDYQAASMETAQSITVTAP